MLVRYPIGYVIVLNSAPPDPINIILPLAMTLPVRFTSIWLVREPGSPFSPWGPRGP